MSNISYMFAGIDNSKIAIDLSTFDMSAITDMSNLFNGSKSIKTIMVSNNWDINVACNTDNMFLGCDNIVGGNGTIYDNTKINKEYARIDTPEENGYFTLNEPVSGKVLYAFNDAGTVLYLAGYKVGTYDWHFDDYSYDKLTDSQRGGIIKVEILNKINPINLSKYFKDMEQLYTIENINYMDTSNVSDFSYMFENVDLTTVDLSNFDTSKATTMKEMFASRSFTSLNLDNLCFDNVVDMSGMFKNCRGFTDNLDVSMFNTMNVTDMSSMFEGCINLESIDLSSFDTLKVIDMSHMFDSCEKLWNLDISNFSTVNVEKMDYMFNSCKRITMLDLSCFNTEKLTSMNSMFANMTNIINLYLKSFDTSNVTSMNKLFCNSDSLQGIYVSDKFVIDNVEEADEMFFECRYLIGGCATEFDESRIDISMARVDHGAGSGEEGYFRGANIEGVVYWYIEELPQKVLHLTSVCPETYNFYHPDWNYNKNSLGSMKEIITKVIIEDEIIPNTLEGWFDNCYWVSNFINLNLINTKNVENMSKLFKGCRHITTINLNSFDTSNVKDMSCIFQECTTLKNIYLEEIDTSNVINMSAMFDGCHELESIDLSNFNTENVTKMDAMFRNAYNIDNIDVSSFDTRNVVNMYGMFADMQKIEKLHIENFYTLSATNMKNMFDNCVELSEIYASEQFVSDNIIGENMFLGCAKLEGSFGSSIAGNPSPNNDDGEFAREDGGVASPGYFMSRKQIDDKIFYNIIDGGSTLKLTYKSHENGKRNSLYNDDKNNSSKIDKTKFDKVLIECKDSIKLKPTDMSDWFSGMINLEEIENLIDIDTSNVVNMSFLFERCKKLYSLDLSSFNTNSVTDMSYMFSHLDNIEVLDVTNLNTSNVIEMSGMFQYCDKLKEIDVSNFDTTNLQKTHKMFFNCSALTNIYSINDFNISDTSSSMFYNCTSLVGGNSTIYNASNQDGNYAKIDNTTQQGYFTNKNISHNVTKRNFSDVDLEIYIDGRYDHEASKVVEGQKVIIKVVGISNPNDISIDSFLLKESIEMTTPLEVSVENFNDKMYSFVMRNSDVRVSYEKSIIGEQWTYYYIEGNDIHYTGKISVAGKDNKIYRYGTVLNDSAKTNIYNIYIDNELKPYTFENMFNGFSAATNVEDIDNIDTSDIRNMSKAFYNCCSLLEIDITNFNTTKVNDMSSMFALASQLTKIKVTNNFSVKNVVNSNDMFSECDSIVGNNGTTYDVTKIDSLYARIDYEGHEGYFCADDVCVSFNTLGGNVIDSKTIKYGDVLGTSIEKPNRNDYEFVCWCMDENCNNSMNMNAHITDNMVLYAKWRNINQNNSSGSSSGGGGSFSKNILTIPITFTDKLELKKVFVYKDNFEWEYDSFAKKWKAYIIKASGEKIQAKDSFYSVITNFRNINDFDTTNYFFDKNGYLVSGWLCAGDKKWYYLEYFNERILGTISYNKWEYLLGKWYRFGKDGSLYINTITDDGYCVNENGEYVESLATKNDLYQEIEDIKPHNIEWYILYYALDKKYIL